MADEDLDKQESINLSIQERLTLLEREKSTLLEEADIYKKLLGTNLDLSQVRSRYQSDEKDILQTIRTNTNILKDQSKQITFQVAEKSRIQKISNDILSISENSYSMVMEELGTSRSIGDIGKKREILAKRIIELESFRGTIIFENKELQAAFNEELENSIKGASDLEAQLTETQNASEKINKSIKWFEDLKEGANKLGLGKFTGAIEEAEKAARKTAVANELNKKVTAELVTAKEEEVKAISAVQTAEEELQKLREDNKQTMLDENKQRNDIKKSLKEKEDILSKINNLSQEELETGEGLTAERLKQLGLADKVKGTQGSAAKEVIKALKAQTEADKKKEKVSLNNLEFTKKERNEKLKGLKDTLTQAKQDKIVSGNRVKGLKHQQKHLAKMTGKAGMKGIKAGAKALGPVLKKALGPIGIILMVKDAIDFVVEALFSASKRTADFQKSLGLGRDRAKEISNELRKTAAGARDFADTINEGNDNMGRMSNKVSRVQVSIKSTLQSFQEINKSLGTNLDIIEDFGSEGQGLLVTTSLLRDNFGLSSKAIAELNKEQIRATENSKGELKTQEDIVKEVFGQTEALNLVNKTQIDAQQVLEDVFSLSEKTRSMFGFQTAEIAKAVYQTRKLGFELDDLNSSADSLLDFESSIAKEIEAEQLLGKDLNLEKARQFALDNDLVGLAGELRKQNVDILDLNQNNRIAAEAYAAAVGQPLETLVKQEKALQEQEGIQRRLNKTLGENATIRIKGTDEIINANKLQNMTAEEYNSLVADGSIAISDLKTILGETIYQNKLAEDAQTKFNKALEMAKEQFAFFVSSGILEDLINTLADFAAGFSESFLFETFAGTEAERLANRQLRAKERIAQTAEAEATVAQDRLNKINKKINELSSSPSDPAVTEEIKNLKSEKDTLQKQFEEINKNVNESQTNQQQAEKDKERVEESGGATGALEGAAAGALAGAAIGSFIPGLGTAIGAAIGAGMGAVAGYEIGESKDDKKEKEFLQQQLKKELAKSGSEQSQELIKTLTEAIKKFEDDPTIDPPPRSNNFTTTNVSDAIIRPDKKQIIIPNEQDVIAAFRPQGVIDKTLSSAGDLAQPLATAMFPIVGTISSLFNSLTSSPNPVSEPSDVDINELAKTNIIAAENYTEAMGASLETLINKPTATSDHTTVIDNSELVNEIVKLREDIAKMNNRPIQVNSTINMDGNKIGTAMGLESYGLGNQIG